MPAEPSWWSCLALSGGVRERTAADDVAPGGAGAYVDRVLARFGRSGSPQIVLHVAEPRGEVQPGRDAVTDTDLDRAGCGFGDDGTTRDLAEADVAVRVFAVTAASAWSTEILPLAAFTRRSPVTSPIRVSPLEFLTTAAPSMLPITKAPEPVLIWLSPAARFTLISPAPLLSCTGPACSSWMSPRPTL